MSPKFKSLAHTALQLAYATSYVLTPLSKSKTPDFLPQSECILIQTSPCQLKALIYLRQNPHSHSDNWLSLSPHQMSRNSVDSFIIDPTTSYHLHCYFPGPSITWILRQLPTWSPWSTHLAYVYFQHTSQRGPLT